MANAPYLLFDVFTDRVFAGNPLAVFPEASLDDATMQNVAREMNLSESVFVSRGEGGAAAVLRIFSPAREMAFAGHPTVGTAIALTDHLKWIRSDQESFTLRLGIGDVPVRIDRGERTTAWLTTPPVTFGREVPREDAATMLGLGIADVRGDLQPQLGGAGNPFFYVGLSGKTAVDRVELNIAAVREHVGWHDVNGIYCFAQTDAGTYARLLAPMAGIAEDAATGSAIGPLYAYLAKWDALPHREHYVSEQGVAMGRPSTLHVSIRWNQDVPEAIEVGGTAVLVGEGTLRIP